MNPNPATAVAFTGHRTYCGEAAAALQRAVETLYAEGCRTFLSGMAAGFDMAAAETVLPEIRQSCGWACCLSCWCSSV